MCSKSSATEIASKGRSAVFSDGKLRLRSVYGSLLLSGVYRRPLHLTLRLAAFGSEKILSVKNYEKNMLILKCRLHLKFRCSLHFNISINVGRPTPASFHISKHVLLFVVSNVSVAYGPRCQ